MDRVLGGVSNPVASGSRVLAESVLAIVLRRRNAGSPAERMASRALARRWVVVARGAA